jgi:outer membrane biosynthesis protein TonB
VTESERNDTRRRWAIATTASLFIHLSLLWWWRGVDFAPGTGPAGGSEGGGAGFGMGSVIEVQIDVDAPVPAGATIPAEDVAVESVALPVETPPDPITTSNAETSSTPDSIATAGGGSTSGSGEGPGQGTGSGSAGTGEGLGTGDGGAPGGTGARTGGASGPATSGTVPPRPVEITWPDTRRLAHCVGLRIDVRIRVDELGRVERVEPASTGLPEDCVRAALDTAKRIKFTPGTVAGKPAALWSLVTIDFEKKK